MRLIERLNNYREYHGIPVANFEKHCELANGYLSKQLKAKGSVGSDILEKIGQHCPDLSMEWLITGRGKMIKTNTTIAQEQAVPEINEDGAVYVIRNELIQVLRQQLQLLESSIPGKSATRKRRPKIPKK